MEEAGAGAAGPAIGNVEFLRKHVLPYVGGRELQYLDGLRRLAGTVVHDRRIFLSVIQPAFADLGARP